MNRDLEMLADLIGTMDVPSSRRECKPEDLLWMQRNLAINNRDHPELANALQKINQLQGGPT